MEPPTPGSLDNPDFGPSLNEVFTPEMREQMVRLEKENEILKRRLAEAGSKSAVEGGGVSSADVRGGEGEERLTRGSGGGGGEKMVAVLRRQLQEKQKKISQLESAAQENSEFTSLRPLFSVFFFDPPLSVFILFLLQDLRTVMLRRFGGSKTLRLRSTKGTSTKPRRSLRGLERGNHELLKTV